MITGSIRRSFVGAFTLLAALSVGCKQAKVEPPTSETTKKVAVEQAAVDKQAEPENAIQIAPNKSPTAEQKKAMLAAKDAMFDKLSGMLMSTMKDQGPAAAMSVCSKSAPEIAKEVGAEHGVSIGRSGVRLRNPKNAAPAWAKSLVEAKSAEPNFVVLNDGRAAALLPIKLKAQCVMCHGADEQIPAPVKKQLAELYPQDAATGFKPEELRGWFWVEMDADS